MKKRLYEKPSMQVIELKQQAQLLQSSVKRCPYGDPIEEDWQDE